VRFLPSTVTVYSTNAAPRKAVAVTAGDSLATSTPRISSAPNAVFGARRRSATGMKTTAMNSSTSGHLAWSPWRLRPNWAPSMIARKAATTQSIAIQWTGRIRFVSGGRDGRASADPGYAGYAPGSRSPGGCDMSRSEPTPLR
jgi:hypothetical protein